MQECKNCNYYEIIIDLQHFRSTNNKIIIDFEIIVHKFNITVKSIKFQNLLFTELVMANMELTYH
jgi:hypothetical protein